MTDAASRTRPRWWDLDDWLLLAIVAPTRGLLRWLRRVPWKPVRVGLSALVITVALLLVVLLILAIGDLL